MGQVETTGLATVPTGDRELFLTTLAWLSLRDESLDPRENAFLRAVAAELQLDDSGVSDAFDRARGADCIESIASAIETRWVGALLVHQLLLLSLADGRYDAREREGLMRVALAVGHDRDSVERLEEGIVHDLQLAIAREAKSAAPTSSNWSWQRIATVGGVTAGAAALLAVTGGLAAPAIGGAIGGLMGLTGAAATSAGLAALGGGSIAAGGLGMAGGTAAIATAAAGVGGAAAASAIVHRTRGVSEFRFERLSESGMHTVIGIPGFLNQGSVLEKEWAPTSTAWPRSETLALRWESKALQDLGTAIGAVTAKVAGQVLLGAAGKIATRSAGMLIGAPAICLQLIGLIDNPWDVAHDRAVKCGPLLADALRGEQFAARPVTLVGFSLGTRVALDAVRALADAGELGSLHGLVLLGGATPRDHAGLDLARRVVSGPIVNVYSRNDWVLTYMYRAREWTVPIGVGPLERPGVTDIDVTDLVDGHLGYVPQLSEVLARVRKEVPGV